MAGRALIAWFLIVEIVLFALASLVHGGRLVSGYEHQLAEIVEVVCAALLGLGFIGFLALPRRARRIALAVQIIALLGVLVGLLAFALGIGPQTTAHLLLDGVLLITLLLGFLFTLRSH